jgi:hypothetical protein
METGRGGKMTWKSYLLTLPERLFRSTVGLSAGVARELGEVVLPEGLRRTQLYRSLVATTLQFMIERVGGAEGVYASDERLADDFLVRRTAGNAVEILGLVAFRASPVWVLAALADLSDLGRRLVPEIAGALKDEGLLEQEATFSSLEQVLDGLERTSSRMASTINTPPLDVATLRQEWQALREDARSMLPSDLPSRESLTNLWARLRQEAARQERSVFETSSMLAVSAAGRLPDNLRWLSASARLAAGRTGHVFAAALLDHYRATLDDMRQAGYVGFAVRQLRPYAQAAAAQFSPERRTLTERLFRRRRPPAPTS